MAGDESGQVTGTKDKTYNLIWFTEQSLSNALRLETYIEDAERDGDSEVAQLFRRAQEHSRRGGEEGKRLLGSRLGQSTSTTVSMPEGGDDAAQGQTA